MKFGELESDRRVALDVLRAAATVRDRHRLVKAALEDAAAKGDAICAARLEWLSDLGDRYALESWLRQSIEPLHSLELTMPVDATPSDGEIVSAVVETPPTRSGRMPGFIPVAVLSEDGQTVNIRIPLEQMTLPNMEQYVLRRLRARRADYAADLAVVAFYVAWQRSGITDVQEFVGVITDGDVAAFDSEVWAQARRMLATA